MPLQSMWNHLKTLPPLFRGELGVMSAELRVKVHRTNGAEYDGSVPLQEWLAQFPVEDMGVVSRKKVTRSFVQNLVANLAGDATDFSQYKFHDLGTGTTAEANTDTGLETAISSPTTRAEGSQATSVSSPAAPTYTTEATCGPLPTATITEHIVATTAARTTTEIIDRSVFSGSPINALSGDFATISYTLTVNAEA